MPKSTISELLVRAEAVQAEIARCRELCANSRALLERIRADTHQLTKIETDSHGLLGKSYRYRAR